MAQLNLPTEIIPGIYQIRLPLENNPAGYINTYLIEGDKERAMVDTGWNDPKALEDFARQLESLGLGLENIDRVIYTHIHPDHFGLAGIIKAGYGIELVAHREGKALIDYRYYGREHFIPELGDWHLLHGGTRTHAEAVIANSTDYTNHVCPVFPDILLGGGETIDISPFHLQVIWTPGHDNDHICIYEKGAGLLFSGDHILPDTVPHIGVHSDISFNPHTSYMESLKALRDIPARTVLPGHERVFDTLPERIEQLLAYHTQLKNEILSVLRAGPKSAYQLSSQTKWIEGPMEWDKLAPVTQAGLVTKALAYLKALCLEGKVEEKVDKNGLRLYNAT
ncbi:MAG: MBL fold metallo-hydrolase [Dehalococcoidia bacterium]